MNNIEEFINELTNLSNKYNMYIGACGCCNSPWIYSLKGNLSADNLQYNEETNIYEYDELRR